MRNFLKPLVFLGLLATAQPVSAQFLSVVDWQAKAFRVTHRDKDGNFTHDKNPAYLVADYRTVRRAMSTGYSRALRSNKAALAQGKPPLFCPPANGSPLSSREINLYFNTLPLEYRTKTSMVDAMLGFAQQKYPCSSVSH